MGKPKLNQILSSLPFLVAIVLFALLIFLFTLSPSSSGLSAPFSFGWVFLGLLIVLSTEFILYGLRKSVEIDESKITPSDKNIWSNIAHFSQYVDLVKSILMLIVVLAFLGYLINYFLKSFDPKTLAVSSGSYTFAGTIVIYLFLRPLFKPYLKKAVNPLGRKLKSSGLQKYTLTENGLVIDLNLKDLSDRTKKSLVSIDFSEIDEIRTFTFMEAATFLEYEVGPNLELVARGIKSQIEYLQGKIAKPTVYTYTATSVLGKIVLLKGPNLFYFMSFDTDDVSDLINSFNAYKSNRKLLI